MKKAFLTLALGMALCVNAQVTVVKSGQTRIGNADGVEIDSKRMIITD